MIIRCPKCNSETLLTKARECDCDWRCDRCGVCCIKTEGIPFQNEKQELEDYFEHEKKFENEETKIPEPPVIEIKVEKKRKGRQMSLFDYLQK